MTGIFGAAPSSLTVPVSVAASALTGTAAAAVAGAAVPAVLLAAAVACAA
jgi:hypothetical protein